MVTQAGVQFYRWYQMGITDAEDLVWLMKFYFNEEWPKVIALASLTTAMRYYENRQ